MIKNKEINEFIEAYQQFDQERSKKEQNVKSVITLAVKAFHSALIYEDPLKRCEMVNFIVDYMRVLARYDSSMCEFLLAKKKMTNYSLLERLTDPAKIKFSLQDCMLLNQRYLALFPA